MATSKTVKKKKVSGGKVAEKTAKTSTNTSTPKVTRKKKTVIETWDGHPLTKQEASFIDEYIQTGNGQASYLKAYPKSNPKNARQNAHILLTKQYIDSEIRHRMEEARTDSIASATEIMQYFTDVMKGKIKDAFGLEASLAERTKAAVELAKRQIDIPNKMSNNEPPEIKITLDWGQGGEAHPTVQEVLGEQEVPVIETEDENK